MTFQLDQIVPWGRSFDEYCRMFALTDRDLADSLLGCADGPASFNAELSRRGGHVCSCDPLYEFDVAEIKRRIAETFEIVLQQTRQNMSSFVWSETLPDVTALGRLRGSAMQQFIDDFRNGQAEGRYLTESLPCMSFADQQFQLAVCSHFLFLYDQLGRDFHVQAMRELMRVAAEVRVFPLLQLNGTLSSHLAAVEQALTSDGYQVERVGVSYEFQCGGHTMLRVRRQ